MSLSTGEVSVLAVAFDNTLDDSCIIYSFQSGTATAYGEETPVYSTGSASCGFKPSRAFTNYLGQLIVPQYDAELRLSLQTVLAGKDLVGFEGNQYKVEGINKGKTGKVVFLTRVEI